VVLVLVLALVVDVAIAAVLVSVLIVVLMGTNGGGDVLSSSYANSKCGLCRGADEAGTDIRSSSNVSVTVELSAKVS
jgi:hypothetical protein